MAGRADIAAFPLSLSPGRPDAIDMTYSFYEAGLGMIVKKGVRTACAVLKPWKENMECSFQFETPTPASARCISEHFPVMSPSVGHDESSWDLARLGSESTCLRIQIDVRAVPSHFARARNGVGSRTAVCSPRSPSIILSRDPSREKLR